MASWMTDSTEVPKESCLLGRIEERAGPRSWVTYCIEPQMEADWRRSVEECAAPQSQLTA